MNYPELLEKVKRKTILLIKNKDWEVFNRLFQIAPKQIYFFGKILEENLKKSSEINELPFIILRTVGEITYYKFNILFELILKLIRAKNDIFSKKFKSFLCAKIFTQIKQVQVYSTTIEIFVDVFHQEITNFSKEELLNHRYNFQILYRLFKLAGGQVIKLLPDIVSRGLYDFGYEIIIKNPKIIKKYRSETEKILENVILHEKQYFSLIQLLEKEDNKLIDIIENKRRTLKQEFYEKLVNSEKGNIDHEWFHNDKFRYTFDLYSDSELLEIIEKIINLEIDFTHYGERNYISDWANLILLETSWRGKRKLFSDFLEKLTDLGYLQVVTGYFNQFPEKIKDSKALIFEKLKSFNIDLLEKHYKAFEIEDSISLFREYITKDYFTRKIVNIFFNNNRDLISDFIDAIKDYFQHINSTQSSNITVQDYYKFNTLLMIIHEKYPEYLPETDLNLIQSIFIKFLSIQEIANQFHPLINSYLPEKFNLFEKTLQEKIMTILIDNKNLSSIEFLLTKNFQNFADYLEQLIDFQPSEDLQSEHLIKVLELIVKNKYDLKARVMERLIGLKDCSRKTQLYSFLKEFTHSKQVLERLLENEQIIPYAINTYLDYKLVNIELLAVKSEIIYLSDYLNEINKIEKDFENFNSSQSLHQNFLFKLNNYKARLYLYFGFQYLQDGIYNKSKKTFEESFNLYERLKETKVIKDNTKRIFDTYSKISDFFRQFMSTIKSQLKKGDFNGTNSLINRHLGGIFENLTESNIQFKRIRDNIGNIRFNSESKSLNQFICEIPTKFCPKPPIILNKCFLDDIKGDPLIVWDKDNKPSTLEPIDVFSGYKKYILILEFAEKERFFDFNLELKEKSYFNITDLIKTSQAGMIHFEFQLNFNEFHGVDELQFIITENDICGFEVKFLLPIIHRNISSLETQVIQEVNSKIKKYKSKEYKPLNFSKFLNQFTDFNIRKSFLINILYRIKDYFYTNENMRNGLIKKIETLPYNNNDEIIFVILNELWNRSPIFWAYDLKKHLNLSQNKIYIKKSSSVPKYLLKYKKRNKVFLIFLDDVIGTGRQFIKFYKNDFLNKYIKYNLQESEQFKYYLVAGVGSLESINYISKTSLLKEDNIRYTRIIREADKAFHLDNWKNENELNMVKNFLKEKDPSTWDGLKHEDEEKGLEYLVVLEWNTPNNTIGCLWNDSETWEALFPRTKEYR